MRVFKASPNPPPTFIFTHKVVGTLNSPASARNDCSAPSPTTRSPWPRAAPTTARTVTGTCLRSAVETARGAARASS